MDYCTYILVYNSKKNLPICVGVRWAYRMARPAHAYSSNKGVTTPYTGRSIKKKQLAGREGTCINVMGTNELATLGAYRCAAYMYV